VQALRESDALKTSILRAVSHDLTTPLTTIALQVESLRQKLGANPAAAGSINVLSEQSDRLRRRIENLLTLARLESGKFVPRPEPTPPADLFHTAREHLAALAERRPFEVQIDDDCPDAMVDPVLAVEILVNLIENADRVSPPGTPLRLVAHRHPVDSSRVRIEVLDEGPGIHQTTEPAERFLSEAEEEGDVGRRGLGLEIAQGLAAANRGEVSLSNRPDGGAAARLDLPAATIAAAAEVAV
jgi:two-component system sensor histidine kinase KdpD